MSCPGTNVAWSEVVEIVLFEEWFSTHYTLGVDNHVVSNSGEVTLKDGTKRRIEEDPLGYDYRFLGHQTTHPNDRCEMWTKLVAWGAPHVRLRGIRQTSDTYRGGTGRKTHEWVAYEPQQ